MLQLNPSFNLFQSNLLTKGNDQSAFPAGIYLFKDNNGNAITISEICLTKSFFSNKDTTTTPLTSFLGLFC